MRLRNLAPLSLLLLPAAAPAAVVLSFGTPSGLPLTALSAPAKGATTTISVFYTSTTGLSDGQMLVAFDRADDQGPSAAKKDGFVALSSPSAAPGVALAGGALAGGGLLPAAPGTIRPYGLNLTGVSGTGPGSLLPATAVPVRLMDLTLTNLDLLPGGFYDLSFHVSDVPFYSTRFFDDATAASVPVAFAPLRVVAAVPEPTPLAAFALAALAFRRRRRA